LIKLFKQEVSALILKQINKIGIVPLEKDFLKLYLHCGFSKYLYNEKIAFIKLYSDRTGYIHG